MALYHERSQHEITYLALRHTLLQGRVLRSGDPVGIEQEMWPCWPSTRRCAPAVTAAVQCHITTYVEASHHQPATRRRKSVTTAEGP